jgi:hypothetical protein
VRESAGRVRRGNTHLPPPSDKCTAAFPPATAGVCAGADKGADKGVVLLATVASERRVQPAGRRAWESICLGCCSPAMRSRRRDVDATVTTGHTGARIKSYGHSDGRESAFGAVFDNTFVS